MGKQLVKPVKFIVRKRPAKKRRMLPVDKVRHKKAMEEIRPHYKKAIRVLADMDAEYPKKDYWLRQIYSPDDVENPLKGVWDRANHLRAAGYDMGKPMLVVMSPQEFLDLSPPTKDRFMERGEYSQAKLDEVRRKFKAGEWEPLSMINNGPFIDIDETGRAYSHEGRHRAIVLQEMGHKEMPVLIYDRSKRGDDWRDEEPWMKAEVRRLADKKRRERELERSRRRLGMPEFKQKRRNK